MLRSHNPPFRSAALSARPSGAIRRASGTVTATTLSPSPMRKVIVAEQRSQSKKYSNHADMGERRFGSPSRRKSRPASRERNGAAHESLQHLASIIPAYCMCTSAPSRELLASIAELRHSSAEEPVDSVCVFQSVSRSRASKEGGHQGEGGKGHGSGLNPTTPYAVRSDGSSLLCWPYCRPCFAII